ncbi:aminoglycoside phosphotransferase family protein [Agromyces protaetiae]|uniref:Aminoglycoside phosphotransferase family protein n=1 Tax=Agromyces protaetiae TaxID=2509455 RepID=A0A4P6F959_9MICO|nr:aminoglycoside phosphotransferase family protein [Agromyces protaetiae]QAY72680.1 aminoglycoside phosphotransferase family protein [Agromyces protaetiae]
MTDAPPPDVPVDADLVARLVASQHPDLAAEVELVANGWDNAVFQLGTDYAVRMPRRELGARLVAGEQRWLPELAERSPVAVPVPVRAGVPEFEYPYPWSILTWLEGRDAASVATAARGGAALALAGFTTALRVSAPADAPVNPYRGVPLATRDEVTRERLASPFVSAHVSAADRAVLLDVWDDALAAPVWAGPPVWVHGDLHPANLLLDSAGGLAAVLDFGDLTSGDPATDLATAWLTFDAVGRAAFRRSVDVSSDTDASDWARARGWAVALGLAIVSTIGVDGRVGRIGAHALAEVLRGD